MDMNARYIRDALLHTRDTTNMLQGCTIEDNINDPLEGFTDDDEVTITWPDGTSYKLLLESTTSSVDIEDLIED
jgi:hypothetical protein